MSKLIGIQKINFVGKDGQPVSGIKHFYTEPFENEKNCEGEFSDSFFLSHARIESMGLKDFGVGDSFALLYDKRGRIKRIDVSDVIDY